jgi:peptidyl-prolyl cis-trans isomerase D
MAKKDKKKHVNENDSAFSEIMGKFKANPALYIGSVVILVLVVVTFVGGDFLSGGRRYVQKGGGDLTFGYYDSVPISWVAGNKLSQYYEQLVRRYRDQIDLNNFQIAMSLWSQAFEAAAVNIAILQEMKRSNFEPPEKIVDKEVAKLPQFQDEKGNFSIFLYRQMSESSRLSLWRQVKEELTTIQFYNDTFGLLVPAGEKEFFAKMGSDMRTIEMVYFLIDEFPDSEYLSYARENSDIFRTIHLSKITVKSGERAAKKILESIKDGTTTFEDAAKAQSQDNYADRGGDMGVQYAYDLEREITDEAARENIFSLGKGELSAVVNLDEKWVFFRVEDELKPADFDDNAVMDRVRSYMRNYERGRMEDWAIARADEFIADAKTEGFENTARRKVKEKISIGPLPINYGNVQLFTTLTSFNAPALQGQELSDLSKNANFWKTAFSTPLNTLSKPLVHGSKVLVFFPDMQIDIDKERADEISSMYSNYWLGNVTEQSLQPFFMNSPRMKNNFWETYSKFFLNG